MHDEAYAARLLGHDANARTSDIREWGLGIRPGHVATRAFRLKVSRDGGRVEQCGREIRGDEAGSITVIANAGPDAHVVTERMHKIVIGVLG